MGGWAGPLEATPPPGWDPGVDCRSTSLGSFFQRAAAGTGLCNFLVGRINPGAITDTLAVGAACPIPIARGPIGTPLRAVLQSPQTDMAAPFAQRPQSGPNTTRR
jgi:hypothetical protein